MSMLRVHETQGCPSQVPYPLAPTVKVSALAVTHSCEASEPAGIPDVATVLHPDRFTATSQELHLQPDLEAANRGGAGHGWGRKQAAGPISWWVNEWLGHQVIASRCSWKFYKNRLHKAVLAGSQRLVRQNVGSHPALP